MSYELQGAPQASGTRITRGTVSTVSLQTLLELLVSRRSGGRMRGHRDGLHCSVGCGATRPFKLNVATLRSWARMRIRSPSAPSRDERRTRVASLRHRTARWTHVQQQQLLLHVTNDKRERRGCMHAQRKCPRRRPCLRGVRRRSRRSNSETCKLDGSHGCTPHGTWHTAQRYVL